MKKLVLLFLFLFSTPLNAKVMQKTPQLISTGQKVFKQNCVACHGEKGNGQGPAAAAIKDRKPRDFTSEDFHFGSSDEEVFKTISVGVTGSAMPSWGHLEEKERWGLVYYIKSLRKH